MSRTEEARELLRTRRLRLTSGRVRLLSRLSTIKKPMSASSLHTIVGGDLVTIYRNLRSFARAELVREIRFGDGVVRYEFALPGSHHHHLVCTDCGTVAELPECNFNGLHEDALRRTKDFASIKAHALEFFGTCRACARA